MFLHKLKYQFVNLSYFVFWFVLGVFLFLLLMKNDMADYWRKDLKYANPESPLDYYTYFQKNREILKMQLFDKDTKFSANPFVKKGVRKVHDLFSSNVRMNKEIVTIWYTPDFLIYRMHEIRGKMIFALLSWIIFGIAGFYLLSERMVFAPLSAVVKGDRKKSGIFSGVCDKINFYKQQADLYVEHTAVLLKAAKSISSHLDLNQMLARLLDIIIDKFPNTSCAITMLDDDGYIRVKTARGMSVEFIKNTRLKRGQGFAGECIETQKIIVVQDTEVDKKEESEQIDRNENIKSFVHVPIIVENKAVGTFNVNSHVKNYFTHEVVSVIATLAEYLSIAITNSKLYERTKDFNRRLETEISYTTSELLKTNTKLVEKIRELKAVAGIFNTIMTAPDLHTVISAIYEKVIEIINVDYGTFFEYDQQSGTLLYRGHFWGYWKSNMKNAEPISVPIGDIQLLAEVVESKRPRIDNNPGPLKWFFLPSNFYPKSLLVFPVVSKGKVLGIFVFLNKLMDNFNEDDMDFLGLLSNWLVVYMEKTELQAKIGQQELSAEELEKKSEEERKKNLIG